MWHCCLFGTPILLLAGLENFPHASRVGIFVHPPEKKSKPIQPPHLYQEESTARFRFHLPDGTVLSSELLSSPGAAIPEQLCRPSVPAFIVLVLQKALVSGSPGTQQGCFWLWVPEQLPALPLSPCPAPGWERGRGGAARAGSSSTARPPRALAAGASHCLCT